MKELSDESSIDNSGSEGIKQSLKGSSSGEGSVKCAGEGVVGGSVVPARIKPKGSSMTLLGSGRRDGSDVNNSMGLVEYYRDVVLKAAFRE